MTDSPAVSVPPGAEPSRCPHCDRPFPRERQRDLHVVEAHPDRATDAERAAHESALDAERDDLWLYHLKVVGALVVVYFGFLYAYAIFA